MKTLSRNQLFGLLAAWGLALIFSFVGAKEYGTWWLETFPVFIGAAVLLYTNGRFPLPRYVLAWVFVHGLVLILGAHYTYAEVPLGFWFRDTLDLGRNHYDRLGHFFQGFVPALITREVLVRRAQVKAAGWNFFLSVTVCVWVSVLYEFIEWGAAIALNQGAESFLGTQGDIWDTQWDMFMATIGAVLALFIYRKRARRDNVPDSSYTRTKIKSLE